MSNYKGIELDPSSKKFKDNLINALLISQNDLKSEVNRLEHSHNQNVTLLNEINLLTQESNDLDKPENNILSKDQSQIPQSTINLNETNSCKLTKIDLNCHQIITIEDHKKLLENIKNKLVKAGESLRDLEFTKQILKNKDDQIHSVTKELNEYKHMFEKTVRKLDSSFVTLKKYLKQIEQQDIIIKGKQDLIQEQETEINNLKIKFQESEELKDITQNQLKASVDKQMQTLNQLSAKELALFNSEQERIKMKKKVEELHSSVDQLAQKERSKIAWDQECKMNDRLDQIDKEKSQIIKFYEEKILEIEKDNNLTVDRICTKNMLLSEERNIEMQKKENVLRNNIDDLKLSIQKPEQEKIDKEKFHNDQDKILKEKINFQDSQIQIISEQQDDTKYKLKTIEKQLSISNSMIQKLENENEKQEKEKKDILKELELLEKDLESEKTKVFKLTNQDRIMCLGSGIRE